MGQDRRKHLMVFKIDGHKRGEHQDKFLLGLKIFKVAADSADVLP